MPEGNFTLTFKDIPRLARDAADYGVKAFLASGWMVGGHDNQYPRYEPDPRLGTWQDLADAINACHALGVKIHFFANIQSVDTSTQWYQKELHQYRVMSAKGEIPTEHYGMGTLSARLGCTAPPLSLCDPAFPQYRGIIVDYMRKLAQVGADGVHYDKVHGGWMDFNPNLPLGPDQAHPSGIIKCLEETLTECRKFSPDFCLGVESHWDRLLSYCDAWWLWHDDDHVAAMKYTFPEFLATFQVVQPWDYANVNRAVQYGYQLLIGPVRWTGSMKDEQSRPISTYIKEVIRIREELKDTIFLGEFLDDQEVAVEARAGLKYAVHRNPETGRRACVLVNHNMKPVQTRLQFEGNRQGRVFIYQPFKNRKRRKLPIKPSIPAERFVIVVEE